MSGKNASTEMVEQLREYKPVLISMLADRTFFDTKIKRTIEEFNATGVRAVTTKAERANELAVQLTQARNQNDAETFLRLLDEWKRCFH